MAFDLDDLFSYHPPTPEQLEHYRAVREGAKSFAQVILDHTPPSADQSAAIRLLRQVVMTANASIALEGKY